MITEELVLARQSLLRAEEEIERLREQTSCTLGVGRGDGKLFVHGDYESIKAAQAFIFRAEQAEAENERLTKEHGQVTRANGDLAIQLVGMQAQNRELHAETERLREEVRTAPQWVRTYWREKCEQAEARTRTLEAALGLARTAMCAPFDDWKGVLERRALDAARAALTEPTPPVQHDKLNRARVEADDLGRGFAGDAPPTPPADCSCPPNWCFAAEASPQGTCPRSGSTPPQEEPR